MLITTHCATCVGINAVTVTVEVDLSTGVGLHLVGLPDSAVKESLLRVVTALASYGYKVPGRKIVVNLAPADIRKEGSSYDLAIAIGLIAVSRQEELPLREEFIIMGELSLDGKLRPVAGALPVAVHARENGYRGCIFPVESALEASDISDIEIYGVRSLAEVIRILSGREDVSGFLVRETSGRKSTEKTSETPDFRDVKGQILARRGLEIAAAGAHGLILIGVPGSGKSFMASCLPSILPKMTREESVETSKIYSISSQHSKNVGLMKERPFRTPHHSASIVSLIGGGQNAAPGEISLAHNGVLYLDEIAQFSMTTLDALRQPMEEGNVTISRARYKVSYPSSFMLISSMNPCPCGYFGDGTGRCTCTPAQVQRYRARISGPLMDRIDMHINVKALTAEELTAEPEGECSASIAERVLRARKIQIERFKDEGIFTNSQMNQSLIRRYCKIGREEQLFLKDVITNLGLSARAYVRILKLARTIADLHGDNFISLHSISEAVQFRSLDRETNYD